MNTYVKHRISPDTTKKNKFLLPYPGFSRLDLVETPLGLSSAVDHIEWFSQYFAARSELVTRIQTPQSLKQNKSYGFKTLEFFDNDYSEFSKSWGAVRFSNKSLFITIYLTYLSSFTALLCFQQLTLWRNYLDRK